MAAAALEGNGYFTNVHVSAPLLVPIYWVEFAPQVIQFWWVLGLGGG